METLCLHSPTVSGKSLKMLRQLKQIRIKAGLTQAQLAEMLMLSNQTRISEYETGARNPSKRVLLLYDLVAKGKLKKHSSRQKAK